MSDYQRAVQRARGVFSRVSRLNHPNLCVPMETFEDERFGFFSVMPYLLGGTMKQYRDAGKKLQKPIPLDQIEKFLREISSALDYVHEQKVIHRDIKPSNIFVVMTLEREIERYCLIDFGLSEDLHHGEVSRDDNPHSKVGTDNYRSPEQSQGDEQDERTDQYSLAVVVYELLTGALPRRRNGELKEIPGLSEQQNRALIRALSFKPGERFETCQDFYDALIKTVNYGEDISEKDSRIPIKIILFAYSFILILILFGLHHLIPTSKQSKETQRSSVERDAELPLNPNIPETELSSVDETMILKDSNQQSSTDEMNPVPSNENLKEIDVFGLGYRFRYCPAGTFMMGSSEETKERGKDEVLHEVTLSEGFWMLETPVTQEMWESVMGDHPSHFKGNRLPVENVSWEECQQFCQKLSEQIGKEISLPTEAQWEYACRAGSQETIVSVGNLIAMGWTELNSDQQTHEVGKKVPNAWGLYDMYGNVCEWCQDWYGDYPNGKVSDPKGPESGGYRVCRGSSWRFTASANSHTRRNNRSVESRDDGIGFRIVLNSAE